VKEKIIQELRMTCREGMEGLLSFLEATDFYTAPASATHHLNVEGGLARHSWNVYEKLKDIIYRNNLEAGIPYDSIVICGLLHDICKIDLYKWEFLRWFKDDQNRWQHKYGWKKHMEDRPWGHGEKSVILLQQHIKLTDTEITSLRWHMGPYSSLDANQYSENFNWLQEAGKNMLMQCLFLADYEATNIMEAEVKNDDTEADA